MENILFEADIKKIKSGCIKILSEIGLEIQNEKILEKLKKFDFTFKDKRIILEEEKVEEFIERYKERNNLRNTKKVDEIRIYSGTHALFHLDPYKKEIQSLNKEILENYTKLIAGLYEKGYLAYAFCPGQPSDLPQIIAPLWQQFLTAKYVKNPILFCYSKITFNIIFEISKIVDAKISIGVHPVSPLKLGGEEFELAIEVIEKGILREFGVASMPVMGLTAPCDWNSAWAQSFAESIGTSIILETLGAEKTYPYGTLYVADMKTGNFVYGSPEHILITIFEKIINKEILNNPPRIAKSLNTTSKRPDIQAGMEKSLHTLIALLYGYTEIGGAGILGVDEIFSPQQIFIDFEIVENVKRILKGVEKRFCSDDIIKIVREGVEQNNFIVTETTLKNFKDFYYMPLLFTRETTKIYMEQNISFLDRTLEMIEEVVKNYKYRISDDKEKEIINLLKILEKSKT